MEMDCLFDEVPAQERLPNDGESKEPWIRSETRDYRQPVLKTDGN